MRKLSLFIMSLLLTLGVSAQSKKAYGILVIDGNDYKDVNSLVSFPLGEENITDFTKEVAFGRSTVNAGAYADGHYYVETISDEALAGAYKTDKLLKVDLEKKNYTEVGKLEGFNNIINDMTYDNQSRVMYAIARPDNEKSALYTIDLTNAAVTKKFDLDRKFITLACNYEGQLYAISFNGEFCKIDKTTGAVEVIGSTGIEPGTGQTIAGSQTMEFDHSDGTLYWSAIVKTVSGMMELTETYLAKVNPKNGGVTRMGNLGTDSQIMGLYIPFIAAVSGAPAKVDNFTVTPDAKGALSADLSWTNPSKTFGGNNLESITKVDVYRGDDIIKTFDNTKPGETITYKDIITADAVGMNASYKVIAHNAAGEGIPAEAKVFVGKDIPTPPSTFL